MKKSWLFAPIALSFLLTGCVFSSSDSEPPPTATPLVIPTRNLIWDEDSVWPSQIEFLLGISEQRLDAASRTAPQAVAFYRRHEFVLVSFKQLTNIDYGVGWTGGNFGFGVFVNGQEQAMVMPRPSFDGGATDLAAEIERALREKGGPRLWDPGFYFESSNLTKNGDEQVTFQFPVGTCHACATNVWLRATYTFGPTGEYLGVKTLGYCEGKYGSPLALSKRLSPCPASEYMFGK